MIVGSCEEEYGHGQGKAQIFSPVVSRRLFFRCWRPQRLRPQAYRVAAVSRLRSSKLSTKAFKRREPTLNLWSPHLLSSLPRAGGPTDSDRHRAKPASRMVVAAHLTQEHRISYPSRRAVGRRSGASWRGPGLGQRALAWPIGSPSPARAALPASASRRRSSACPCSEAGT